MSGEFNSDEYKDEYRQNVQEAIERKITVQVKVFLGISWEERKIIRDFAKKNPINKAWFDKYANVIWIKPELIGTVHYMHETENGGMCQPVWKGLSE